ncbi:MAG: vitamin K epoxide reductase family protein [Patescibacteria group bacterium]
MNKFSETIAKYRKWVMALAIIGIGLAAFLYYEYATQNSYGVCNINDVFNCKPITEGVLATFWGIPVSIIGGVGYTVILLTAFLKKFKWSFYMTVFGMLFCLRLTFLEIFVEQVICLVCMACQTIMLIELILTYQLAYPEKVGLTSSQESKTK